MEYKKVIGYRKSWDTESHRIQEVMGYRKLWETESQWVTESYAIQRVIRHNVLITRDCSGDSVTCL